MRQIARVSKMPERLPWVEGEDYHVILGMPEYGYPMRVRDETGEAFHIYGHAIHEITSDDPRSEIAEKIAKLAKAMQRA